MTMRSLRRRLIMVVVISVVSGFLLIAVLTWRIVSDAVVRDFDARLTNALGELTLAVDFGDDRILSLSRDPEDPVFNPRQWFETDFVIWLTKQQPTSWQVSTGRFINPPSVP